MDYLQYIVFNVFKCIEDENVLNLVINGLPSIPLEVVRRFLSILVLNLVINGLPSILIGKDKDLNSYIMF